jgi:hypothetical protein
VTAARCLDCIRDGVQTARRATGRPLLCATHRRARKFNRRTYNHTTHILNTYNLTADEYVAMYESQGGKCALCRRATGERRKLAVDHCHRTGMIRSLLCSVCNKYLGHARDDIEYFARCIAYLNNPPAVQVIGVRITPDMVVDQDLT